MTQVVKTTRKASKELEKMIRSRAEKLCNKVAKIEQKLATAVDEEHKNKLLRIRQRIVDESWNPDLW